MVPHPSWQCSWPLLFCLRFPNFAPQWGHLTVPQSQLPTPGILIPWEWGVT